MSGQHAPGAASATQGPVTLVMRLMSAAALEGRLVGHVEVVRSGEVVSITSATDLADLAYRLAASDAVVTSPTGGFAVPNPA